MCRVCRLQWKKGHKIFIIIVCKELVQTPAESINSMHCNICASSRAFWAAHQELKSNTFLGLIAYCFFAIVSSFRTSIHTDCCSYNSLFITPFVLQFHLPKVDIIFASAEMFNPFLLSTRLIKWNLEKHAWQKWLGILTGKNLCEIQPKCNIHCNLMLRRTFLSDF